MKNWKSKLVLTALLSAAFSILAKAQEHGALMGTMGEGKIRAVTHYGIDAQDIATALAGIRRALIEMRL